LVSDTSTRAFLRRSMSEFGDTWTVADRPRVLLGALGPFGSQPAKTRTGSPRTPTSAQNTEPVERILADDDVLLGRGDEQLVEVLAAEGASRHLPRWHLDALVQHPSAL
jgi:hypothetical protein